MRILTKQEREILDEDLKYLARFCKYFSLIDTKTFKERFNGTLVKIGDFAKGDRIKGRTLYNPNTIELNEDIFNDDYLRRRVIYHEIGHLLFNYELMNKNDLRKLIEKQRDIADRTKGQNHYLEPNPNLAMAGYKMLQEYIVEKFSTIAANSSLHLKTKKKNRTGAICGENYRFDTSFDNNYGLIESVCDKFFAKYYVSSLEILIECLNNNFYIELYDKYNEEDLFRFLENLGRLYTNFDAYNHKQPLYPAAASIKVMKILEKISSEAKLSISAIKDEHVRVI